MNHTFVLVFLYQLMVWVLFSIASLIIVPISGKSAVAIGGAKRPHSPWLEHTMTLPSDTTEHLLTVGGVKRWLLWR